MNPNDSALAAGLGAFFGFATVIGLGFALDYAARRIHRAWSRARRVLDEIPAPVRLDDYRKSAPVVPLPRIGGQR